MSSFEKRVREELEKTGLTTEIKATRILKENGWIVYNEYPYLDREANKMRLLDIKATKTYATSANSKTDNSSKSELECELYIECKKSTKHSWVFYTDIVPYPYIALFVDKFAQDYMDRLFETLSKSEENTETKTILSETPKTILSKIPIRLDKMSYKIALSHKVIFGKKDEFYEAQMQILKALHAEETSPRTLERIVAIPLILFDGNLFECYYRGSELHVSKINYTRYLSHGLPEQKITALIDVVTLEYFSQYLQLLEEQFPLLLKSN